MPAFVQIDLGVWERLWIASVFSRRGGRGGGALFQRRYFCFLDNPIKFGRSLVEWLQGRVVETSLYGCTVSINTHRKCLVMTSSQGATSCHLWSTEPEMADDDEKVFPVSRLRVSRQHESERRCPTRAVRFQRHVSSYHRRRGWSGSGQWSVSGLSWSVLLVSLAVTAADSSPDEHAVGRCRAHLNGTVIDLDSVRYIPLIYMSHS